MEQWITQELERTKLGDSRRTKRLIKIGDLKLFVIKKRTFQTTSKGFRLQNQLLIEN
ncbi:transposase DNA-binding-containing protein [Nostoc sp. DedQUE12b]|uniref:transposase DNA-binding-containing protein n=1 Tax=Nostoc sp. DedQUE12b TaxID=3075398 RepID=UPI003A101489